MDNDHGLFRPYWPYTRRTEIRRGLKLVVGVTSEPIDIDTARQHLRLDTTGSPPSHPDDSLLTTIYIPAAREACEQYLGAALAPQTFQLSIGPYDGDNVYGLGAWGDFGLPITFELPMGPLLGVESVTYVADGVDTPFTGFDVDTYTDRIRLQNGSSWPTTDDVPNPIIIRYQAGYSLPSDSPQDYVLPSSLRAAMLLTLSQVYDNCTQGTICDIHDLPAGVKYLLDPYKRRLGWA